MTQQKAIEIMSVIRRSDAFTNAATVLLDAEKERGPIEGYPEFWTDIQELVIPTLEAEAKRAGEELARLKRT